MTYAEDDPAVHHDAPVRIPASLLAPRPPVPAAPPEPPRKPPPPYEDQLIARLFLVALRAGRAFVPVRAQTVEGSLCDIAQARPSGTIPEEVELATGRLGDQVATTRDADLLLELARWAHGHGQERARALAAQAESLAGRAALGLAIVFGVGAMLIGRATVPEPYFDLLRGVYALALVVLTAAFAVAARALGAGEYRSLDQAELFKPDLFSSPERHRAQMAVAVWRLSAANALANERCARLLRWGQWLFFAALAGIVILGITLTVGAGGTTP